MDPLLYSCSSMFILGAAMFVVRIFPLVIKVIFVVFKKIWSPAMYASFLRMLRSRSNQNFIMIFLILTMALGIFSAETAHTINRNAEDKIRYVNGADVIVSESWAEMTMGSTGVDDQEIVFTEPDFTKYHDMDEDALMTRVLYRGNVSIAGASSITSSLLAPGLP